MNPEAREILNTILDKEPEDLSLAERRFLRARRSYLKKSQVKEYQEILDMVELPTQAQEDNPQKPEHLKAPEELVTPYNELLKKAYKLGYKGKRSARKILEDFVKEKSA